ncbi:MAG: Hsp33 family molecular chaperone HslO [bacterium]|nr:Hsp33 family molecular chaperone HslO [bacterium]
MDKLVHGIAAGGDIRVFGAITTDTVAEAIRRHQTSPTVSAALGRTMTGALMMGSTLKELDRLTVKIEGDGPVGGITAESNAKGGVRGFVKNPAAELPPKENGKFDVSGVVGQGMFYVIREAGFDIGLRPEPYVGSVPIVSGEIAEDFAFYLAKSEQIPSAVMLGVLLNNVEPFVAASGGVMVQMMPGANEHLITMIEDTIANAPHLTTIIDPMTSPEELIKLALGEIDFEILGENDVAFECTCSSEKAIAMISALGPGEVRAMIAEQGEAVMTCGFCSEVYSLDEQDLRKLL